METAVTATPSATDIAVVGAGPAGCAAALALADSGLRVVLIDRATFPRDKVCGDAIPGPAFKALHAIRPAWADRLFDLPASQNIRSSRIVSSSGRSLTLHWVTRSYNARRTDFDAALLQLVREETDTVILEGKAVQKLDGRQDGVELEFADATRLRAQLVIGADGANGQCARQLAGFKIDHAHHCAAVRVYAKNMKGLTPDQNLFFLLRNHLPGYFWIFPLTETSANVGFGMLSETVKTRGRSLRHDLLDIIEKEPVLQPYFQGAQLSEDLKGFGLPLGSRRFPLTGHRFLLCGDAGSLIDPLQGHGIDKAMISGRLAALRAWAALREQRFDPSFLAAYEREVYARFGSEFRRNYRLMQWLNRQPALFEWAMWGADNPVGRRILQWFS